MFKNYFKIALRNLGRHKAYSILNISGLAIGMACSILILLWVQQELSYDRFHKNADSIYRLRGNAGDFHSAVSPAGTGPGLKSELPEVKDFVRLSHLETTLLEYGEQKFQEKNTFYADSNFLDLFSFELAEGNRKQALERRDAIVITQSMAKKYFGSASPLGKTLKRNNRDLLTVTAVFKDIPSNSHLKFDCIMPMSAIASEREDLIRNTWSNFNFYTYVLMSEKAAKDAAALKSLESKIDKIYKRHVPAQKIDFHLQALTDIHLHSNFQVDLPGHGNVQYVNIFLVVAIFILVVACINFMNLATARSARRAREVGIRKVAGAHRSQLILQFIGEALITSFVALLIAVGIVLLVLPLFNEIAGKEISFRNFDTKIWLGLLAMAVATGLISGSYPAMFLSGFRPVKVLKGSLNKSGGNLFFRNALVVTQFVVSIVLLIGTVVVYRQLNFIHNRNMGFDKENLVYLKLSGDLWNKTDAIKTAMLQNPLTKNFTIIDDIPTNLTSGTIDVSWDGKDPNMQVVFPSISITPNFTEVFKMKLLYGRSFSDDYKGDSNNYVVNERALQVMGMKPEEAVGKNLAMWKYKGVIIGVVKDFNFKPIQQPIEPLIMDRKRWNGGVAVVRAQAGSTEATITALKKINTELNPAFPADFGFLDQDIARLYAGEERLGKLFNIFAVLAIFISCIGLYGLSAFMAEQRKREIGVRKVLGATSSNIVYLLSTGFTRLIVIAVIIAIPLAWYAINSWLQSFAYHIEISWGIFVVASLAALLIAWITVSYESLKAALTNPVKNLRSE